MSAHPSAEPDPLRPPPPQPAFFDAESCAWVLSRYADVLAAFREPRLWPVGTKGQDQSADRDDTGRLLVRGELRDALSPFKMAKWQAHMEALAHTTLRRLPVGRPADLIREFAQPLCFNLAMLVLEADPADGERLAELGAQVFARGPQAEEASAGITRIFQEARIPQGEPTFVGLSQTLPRLLATGWLALLRHPAELARLRAEPDLMPRAVEELLRYAGLVPMLSRRAMTEVDLVGLRISKGAQVNLMLASANRDPEQFPDPDRLDVGRRPSIQVALGLGRNSCVGAVVIRMVYAVTTGALLTEFGQIEPVGTVAWHRGSGFCWPTSVNVQRSSRNNQK